MDQMLHLVSLFLLFWTSYIQCSRLSIHQSLRDELFSDYNPLSAPLDPSKPILIQFHITPKYFDVRDDGFIEGEFWYSWVWRDSRLTWNETVASVPRIRVDRDMIWRPDIVPLSGDVKEEFDDRISALVDNDGQVTWSPKVFLRARCSGANFKDPWKEFRCTLKYGSWSLPRDIIDFYEGSASGMYNDPDSPVDLKAMTLNKDYEERHQNGKIYSVLRVDMILQRRRLTSLHSIVFRPKASIPISTWSSIYKLINTLSFGLL